jgi:hypothetical protein
MIDPYWSGFPEADRSDLKDLHPGYSQGRSRLRMPDNVFVLDRRAEGGDSFSPALKAPKGNHSFR